MSGSTRMPWMPSISLPVLLLAAFIMTATSGCGDGRVLTAPVSGRVLVDGKPAAGAVVVLHPAEGTLAAGAEKLRPMGRSDDTGEFALGTWESSDGAPAGTWKATVEWYAAEGATANADPESSDAQVDRLGGAYADPDTSPLSLNIPAGGVALPPFELQSKR